MTEKISKARWRLYIFMAALACLSVYLIGNDSVPLWDRDEGWYAQSSKQMWETGDFIVPHFLDNLRTEKPIFVYWLQLGGYWLFCGPGDFAVRFYSGIAQTLVIFIIAVGFWKLIGPNRAFWSSFIYGSCAMVIISGKMCLTDATLMVFVTLVQITLMAFYLGHFSWLGVLGIAVALGFGMLTKGPVVLVMPVMTILILGIIDWRRWWPYFRPTTRLFWEHFALILLILTGMLAAIIAVCLPWVIELHRREPLWLPAVFGAAERHLTQAREGHDGIFGYYLLTIWGTFFPWSLLLPTAAYIAWKQRHVPHIRFATAAIIGPWLFFEFMVTKLPHYTLPTFPFIALLVADAIIRCYRGQYLELVKKPFQIAVAIWALPIGLLASAPWIAAWPGLDLGPLPYLPMTLVSLVGLACTFGTWYWFYTRRPLHACLWMGSTFLLLVGLFYGWVLPRSYFLHPSSRTAAILAQHNGVNAPIGEVKVLVYQIPGQRPLGFRDPTLPYYQGGTIRELIGERILETLPPEQWPRLMVITDQIWNIFDPEVREQLEILGTVRAFLYAGDQSITDLKVVTRKKQ